MDKCAGTPLCCGVKPAANISAYGAVLTDPWKEERQIK
jgi:hypothetical protein